MSQENVEVLRRGYESWNRGDRDAAFESLEPEFELQLPEGGMNVGSFQGREGASKLFEDYLEVFDFFHMEPEEFFEAGDRIVVFVRTPARGKGSGVEVEFRPAHVWTMRAGKAVRLEVFPERQNALEAVGLSEQDAHVES
jgi:ketosteroid isomerase-like protein